MASTSPVRLKCFGLTGGIAAGKSQVAALLKKEGIAVIDLDKIGREITDNNPALIAQIQELCGQQVAENGKLNRAKVREAIFTSPEKRKELEALLHPVILKRFNDECDQARNDGARLLVCEAALLIESGYYKHLDDIIVVIAPTALRKERLIARDRISEALADRMIQAQISDEERLKIARVVIQNSGNFKDLKSQVKKLARKWKEDLA